MKTITICDKEYEIDCNALTQFNFKKIFNKGIFKNIGIINNFYSKQTILTNQFIAENKLISDKELVKKLSISMLPDLDDYIEAVTEIAYICCYTANENIGSYEIWLKGIPRINTNDEWIVEVTEFAVDCFC